MKEKKWVMGRAVRKSWNHSEYRGSGRVPRFFGRRCDFWQILSKISAVELL